MDTKQLANGVSTLMSANPYICLRIILVLCISTAIGCRSDGGHDYSLHQDILKYTTDSFALQQTIGTKQKIGPPRIRNGKVLMITTEGNHGFIDSCFIVIGDVKTKKIEYTIRNNISEYTATIWDLHSNQIVAASAVKAYDLFFINLKTGDTLREHYKDDFWPSFSDMLIFKNQLFYLYGVTGTAFIDLQTKKEKMFKNPGIVTTHYESTITSYPLDTTINLLSGYSLTNDILVLQAIDQSDSIRWTYLLKQTKQYPIALLNYPHSFVAKYDSILVALDKTTGQERWRESFNDQVVKAYKWNDKILVYSLAHENFFDTDTANNIFTIRLLDSKDGAQCWGRQLRTFGRTDFAIINNKLLFGDAKSFIVFSLDSGKVLDMKSFEKKDRDHYAFGMYTDPITGDYYLQSYDDKIYW